MHIRVAKPADLPAILDCEARAFKLTDRNIAVRSAMQGGTLAKQVRAREVHLIADAGRIVGYMAVVANGDHLYLHAIAVLPAHQRRGLGGAMLAHAERVALELGLGSVKLFTDGNTSATVRFYRQHGYIETGRCEHEDFSRVFFTRRLHAGRDRTAAAQSAF